VSTERLLDDLARTLAEPMPRSRAMRVIGASIAAVGVPGLGPQIARAATRSASLTCKPPYKTQCTYNIKDPKQPKGVRFEIYCCGPPKWQYDCNPDVYKGECINLCPSRNPVTGKRQFPCTAAGPDERGIIAGDCCPRPESIGCTPEGKCIPNCKFFAGQFARQCGSNCCQPGQICKDGKCRPCPHDSCTTPGGATICCERPTTCCFNKQSAVCCGPHQTCRAQNRKSATCTCDSGTKCGPDCCKKGETCCGGEECCKPGETCLGSTCCVKSRVCGGISCCETGEYCLHKRTGTIFNIPQCVANCTPGNQAGTQCCGTGYKPNKSKTGCVPE
jgi:hypothetical protein